MSLVKVYIYALVNPINNHLFYVGTTLNPKNRLASHQANTKSKFSRGTRISRREKYLSEMGCLPKLIILETVMSKCANSGKALEVETFWAWQLKGLGFPIVNASVHLSYNSPNSIQVYAA